MSESEAGRRLFPRAQENRLRHHVRSAYPKINTAGTARLGLFWRAKFCKSVWCIYGMP